MNCLLALEFKPGFIGSGSPVPLPSHCVVSVNAVPALKIMASSLILLHFLNNSDMVAEWIELEVVAFPVWKVRGSNFRRQDGMAE